MVSPTACTNAPTLAALLRNTSAAGAHREDRTQDDRDDRPRDECLESSAAGVRRDTEELFYPVHEFVPPRDAFVASSHFARLRRAHPGTVSMTSVPAFTVRDVTRTPGGILAARTRANVSATFCLVESGRFRDRKSTRLNSSH